MASNGKKTNISYSILLNLLNAFLPMLSIPLITRAIGLENYGHYVSAALITNILVAIFCNGLFSYYTRLYLSDESKIGKAFSIQVMLMLCTSILHLFILSLIGSYTDISFIIFLIVTVSNVFNVEWYFYCKGLLKVLFFRTLFIKVLSLLVIYCLSLNTRELKYFVMVSGFSLILSNLVGFIYVVVNEKITKVRVPAREILVEIKYFISNASLGAIYQYFDQVVVSIIASKEQLALLNLYKQLINGVCSFPGVITRVIMKDTQKAIHTGDYLNYIKRTAIKFLVLISLGCVALYIIINPIASYLSKAPIEMVNITSLLSVIIVFSVSAAAFIDTQISVLMHKEKITTYSNLCVAIFTLILVYPLVSHYGFNGGLLSLAIGESIGVFIMLCLHIKTGTFKRQ